MRYTRSALISLVDVMCREGSTCKFDLRFGAAAKPMRYTRSILISLWDEYICREGLTCKHDLGLMLRRGL